MTVTDTGGPGKCPGTGTYSIKVTRTTLRFKKITDACGPRAAVVTSGPWRKS